MATKKLILFLFLIGIVLTSLSATHIVGASLSAPTGGTGLYQYKQSLGSLSRNVGIGDFNGDGHQDAVIATGNTGIMVWMNDSTATFTNTQFMGTRRTRDLAVGDLDGDGDQDIVAANINDRNMVWINNGSGFYTGQYMAMGTDMCPENYPHPGFNGGDNVELGDLDGDGDLDALVLNYDWGSYYYWNNGNGTFSCGKSLGSIVTNNEYARDVKLGDLDGDGDLDAVFIRYYPSSSGNNFFVRINYGSGILGDVETGYDFDYGFNEVELGDVDQDGDLDAVLMGAQGGPCKVMKNNGYAGYSEFAEFGSCGSQWGTIALGDVDGDSDLDLVFAIPYENDRVWFNDGSGTFSDTGSRFGGAGLPSDVELGDLDGDGDLDILVGDNGSSPDNKVFLNHDGDGFIRVIGNSIRLKNFGANLRVYLSIYGELDGGGSGYKLNYFPVDLDEEGGARIKYFDHGTEINAGDEIMVMNAASTVLDSLVKADVEVYGVDPYQEFTYGSTISNKQVLASVDDDDTLFYEQTTTSSGDGLWTADFNGQGIPWELMLYYGASVEDEDGDETVDFLNSHDEDGDLISDSIDNVPDVPNWDQSDIDNDGVGDIGDCCPGDPDNMCNIDGSASAMMGSEGDYLSTLNGRTSLTVPPGALSQETSMSITDQGSGFAIETDVGESEVIASVEIGPPGTQFQLPITIVLSWEDEDGDGIVDGTNRLESDIFVSKDGVKITGKCGDPDPGCNMNLNTFTVEVTSLSEFALAILNIPSIPVIQSITAPLDPVLVGTEVSVEATFANPGDDFHTALWYWGDGTSSAGVVENMTVFGDHVYGTAGVYTISLEVEDDDESTDTKEYQFVVVFDPEGGFVTGGGWFMSTEGACQYNECEINTTGVANFGFVSRYKKGATMPTGNTEFQFKAGNLNFHSSDYDWLVVAGQDNAKYKGVGTINGTGEFKFMLTATDGILDTFRIKIWDDDGVIYDNKMGVSDDSYEGTELGGGNIMVHRPK